jgi:hypothetical protein
MRAKRVIELGLQSLTQGPKCLITFSENPILSSPISGSRRVKRRPETEIFTKFENVKSRTSWTAERRKLLEDMRDRGEKAAAIAAALGCKVGAVNVARAQFGLKPRRHVSGRPPSQPDEPSHKIDRVTFFTSRLMEFCTEKELVAQTGHESYEWPLVVVKELVDNSIDACEEAGVAPVISVIIWSDQAESGSSSRTTVQAFHLVLSRASPTTTSGRPRRRPYQSNPRAPRQCAKDRFADGLCAGGGKGKGETWIEARGVRHRILFSVNQIRQEPIVQDIRTPSKVTTGTCVTVFWPKDASIDAAQIVDLLTQFRLVQSAPQVAVS